MNKREMIDIIVRSPAWDGSRDKKFLEKSYSLQEIKDAYSEMDEAEQEYYGTDTDTVEKNQDKEVTA